MARSVSNKTKIINTALAGTLALLMFFPILWIVVLSFKTEEDAIRAPLEVIFSSGWTLESFGTVQARSNYFKHFTNSVIISFGSTILGLLIAIPAAWAMAFVPAKRTKDVLMWMLSTKMLPPVGVLVPIYLI
ncbi:MAG: carbohydrate ABC transporter permease, partial [Alphaproteobacteria bacterium]